MQWVELENDDRINNSESSNDKQMQIFHGPAIAPLGELWPALRPVSQGEGACWVHHALIYQPSSLDATTVKSDSSQHVVRYRAQVHICRVKNWYVMWCLEAGTHIHIWHSVWTMKVPLEERLSFNKLFVLCWCSLDCLLILLICWTVLNTVPWYLNEIPLLFLNKWDTVILLSSC